MANIDYDALAAKFGGTDAQPVNYDALAAKFGGVDAQNKPAQPSAMDSIKQGIGNLAAGALRGAGSIGATILSPVDAAARALNIKNVPIPLPFVGDINIPVGIDRRTAMDQGLQDMGADPNSAMYKTGKIGTEIAGTAGAGGVLANGVRALSSAPRALQLADALQSGGIVANGASMPVRVAGGAGSGAAQALMVDPSQTGAGAIVGGVLPPAVKLAGIAGQAVKNGIGTVASGTIGATTGAGGNAVSQAFQAGKNGDTSFLDNMRGNVSFNDVVDQAKSALQNMRINRGNEYRSGMIDISADKSVIPFQPISDAVDKISSMGTYKGQQINKNAAGTVQDLADTVNQWANLDPAEYHTPEGLDALKQAIGDIRDTTQFGTAARRSADTVYNAVKDQITAQAPVYSKVMKDYADASNTLRETEQVLSLGDKASKDTAIRKLQSLMRNNVATNYGNRLDVANNLQDQGGVNIIPAIAGQAMNSLAPRGLIGIGEKGAGIMSAWSNPASIPALIAAAPFTSPRLMGEAAYKLGQASSAPAKLSDLIAQRIPQLQNSSSNQTLSNLLRSAPLIYGINRVNQ